MSEFDPYAPPGTPSQPTHLNLPNGGPSGVKGWLRFLCIWQVVFMPLQVLVQIHFTRQSILHVGSISAADLNLTIAQSSLRLGIALYGAVVGIQMWRGHRSALKRMRTFLVARLGLRMVSILMTWACILLTSTSIKAFLLSSILLAVAHFAITWLYLKHSKRVANTFPETVA